MPEISAFYIYLYYASYYLLALQYSVYMSVSSLE